MRSKILFWIPAVVLVGVGLVLLVWPEKAGSLTMLVLLLVLIVASLTMKGEKK